MSSPAFVLCFVSTSEDPESMMVLRALLGENEAELAVQAVSTLEAAIAFSADVLILFMEDGPPQERRADLAQGLKDRKVIGIGYGAAQLFGTLGLEIQSGNCAHLGTAGPKIIVEKNDLIPALAFPDPLWTVQLSPEEIILDHFAMYIPRYSHLCSVVDVIARLEFEENYAPIVRQGNFVMSGLVAPPKLWTPAYADLFQKIVSALHGRNAEPFSKAQWPVTQPGIYDFTLAESESTKEASERYFYFRFAKPTTFSATLRHTGSENMMLLFMGERNREHWTREDARTGEVLNITIDITEEDLKQMEDWYWFLHVTNFDSVHTTECSLRIEYQI